MTLASVIAALGASRTPDEIVALLGEVIEVGRDATPYTWAGITPRLFDVGVDPAIVVNADVIIRAVPNGGSLLDRCLSSGGLHCSDDRNRQLLMASEATDPSDAKTLVDAMLAIGVTSLPRWSAVGLGSLPTVAEVQEAVSGVEINQQAKAALVNEIINPRLNDTSVSLADLKAAIAEFQL